MNLFLFPFEVPTLYVVIEKGRELSKYLISLEQFIQTLHQIEVDNVACLKLM